MRDRWRTRFRRTMARPIGQRAHLPEPGPRGRVVLGWVGAGLVVALVAFIVGRPAGDAGEIGTLRSPVPSSAPEPQPIVFGRALDPDTLEAVDPTETYRRGDTFAYSVTLAQPPGTDTVYVRVDRVGASSETVQDWTDGAQAVAPDAHLVSFEVPANALLDAFGPGRYRMQMSLMVGGEPVAVGTFELAEDPAAS